MKILTSKLVRRLTVLIMLDLAFFGWTNAASVPSFIIIIGFLLFSASLYYLIYGLVGLSRIYGISVRQKSLTRYLTLVISSLIALQSIGQLSQRDVVVLFPLAVLAYLYSAYAKAARRNLES